MQGRGTSPPDVACHRTPSGVMMLRITGGGMPPPYLVFCKSAQRGRREKPPSTGCVSSAYFARVRLYLAARASRVPSAMSFAMKSLNLAVRSEPLRKLTPYSSEVRLREYARSA